MKSKLIALDIDGTILDNIAGISVPAAVREAINDAREAGAKVCLSSSRPTFFMQDATKGLDEIDALVGCSGASIVIASDHPVIASDHPVIASDHPVIASAAKQSSFIPFYNDRLSLPIIHACLEIAKKWNLYLSFPGEEVFYARKKKGADNEPESYPFIFMNDEELLKKLQKAPVSCAFLFDEPGMPEDFISQDPSLAAASVHWSGENTYTITEKGVDKGTGVLRLADHWGIPREAILSVGNDANDIPMMKVSGVSVAVENANPVIFEYADWIAPSVKDAGAAEAIRRFAL